MIYYHIPAVQIDTEKYDIGVAKLVHIDFDTLSEFDQFWANRSLHKKARPLFWVEDTSDFYDAERNVGIFHVSLALLTKRSTPNPRLSIAYLKESCNVEAPAIDDNQNYSREEAFNLIDQIARSSAEFAIHRKYGPCNRSLVMAASTSSVALNEEALRAVAQIFNILFEAGADSTHWVFKPVHMFQSVELSGDLDARLLATTVALEGLLLGEMVEGGIANNISNAIANIFKICQKSLKASDLNRMVKNIYAARSDLIHNRAPSREQVIEANLSVTTISSLVVVAIIQMMHKMKVNFNSDQAKVRALWA